MILAPDINIQTYLLTYFISNHFLWYLIQHYVISLQFLPRLALATGMQGQLKSNLRATSDPELKQPCPNTNCI